MKYIFSTLAILVCIFSARGQDIPAIRGDSLFHELHTTNPIYSPGPRPWAVPSYGSIGFLPEYMPERVQGNLHIDTKSILGEYSAPSSAFFRNDFYNLSPIGWGYANPVMGMNTYGVRNRFDVTDRFSITVDSYMANSFFGPTHPHRSNAGVVNATAYYKIGERLIIFGNAQYSTDRHMNPFHQMSMGFGNSYGGGAVFMITENFGIGGSFQRQYINGKWQNTYMAYPVFHK